MRRVRDGLALGLAEAHLHVAAGRDEAVYDDQGQHWDSVEDVLPGVGVEEHLVSWKKDGLSQVSCLGER